MTDLCHKDGRPCYVGKGTDDAHFRCGTVQCGGLPAKEPEHIAADGTVRKDHYGAGRQPWDDIVAAGWGPIFSAGNALKYVRRYAAKNGEDDLEKGRWYMSRLDEFVAAEVAKYSPHVKGPAQYTRDDLLCIITRQEHALLLHNQGERT